MVRDFVLDVIGFFIPDNEVEYWNRELSKGLHKVVIPILWDAFKALTFVSVITFAVYILLVMVFVTFG